MPTYEYEVITPDGHPGRRFEVQQRMSDPPLTHDPETGEPVQRVLHAPRIGGRLSDGALNATLKDNRKLAELGFTKYQKTGDGSYRKMTP